MNTPKEVPQAAHFFKEEQMRKHHLVAASALGVAAMLTMTACSGNAGGSGSSGGQSDSLTVWLMQDTLTADSQAAIVKKFEDENDVTLKVEIQQWDNINTKLTTALATDNPPDVVEIGNTDVPLFAANGALMDITSQKKSLSGGDEWLTGLEGPATVDGKLYAAPFYAGTRAVIYDKQAWAAAGITAAPTSYTEFTADLDKIKAQNPAPDFSPIYLTGTYWYNAISFLYDAGGSLAEESGGKWKAQLSTPESQKGLENFKQFQNAYSTTASQTAPLDTPNPTDVLATGKTATIMGNGNALKTVEESNPALKGQVGSFPFPSETDPGKNMPNFLGGSDIAIAAKSKNQDLALKFLTMIDSPDIQVDQISTLDGHIPVSQNLIDKASAALPDEMKAFYASAKLSISTPATPGWATIESDKSVLDFFSQVASGSKTPAEAASDFDSHLETALNADK
jgi:N,N'-diacetylchitobiose transport system substrate-binding protein